MSWSTTTTTRPVYEADGLVPESPPETWVDLVDVCDAVAPADSACFATGNKDALGIEFWFGAFAQDSMTADELAEAGVVVVLGRGAGV